MSKKKKSVSNDDAGLIEILLDFIAVAANLTKKIFEVVKANQEENENEDDED